MVAISDSGPGVAPALSERIFDPFFSSGPRGDGPGLGLSVARQLARELGARLEFETAEGSGTTFFVGLPVRAQRGLESDAQPVLSHEPPTVLVIDEDERTLAQLSLALSDEFQVVAKTNPREALEHLLAGASYDLVLCDLELSQLSGIDFYAELVRAWPQQGARLVFMRSPIFGQRAWGLLAALELSHVNKWLPARELTSELAGFVRLWSSLGIANPRAK